MKNLKNASNSRRKVTDKDIASMAAVTTATVVAADVVNDKGTGLAVLPWIRFTPEAQAAYNKQQFGYARFDGLQISLSKRLTNGSATQTQEAGQPLFAQSQGKGNPVNFNSTQGQPVVDVDVDLLKALIGDVQAHRETKPVGAQEAFDASKSYRETMGGSQNGWPGFRKTNRNADFSTADALASQAEAKFRQVRDSNGRDYREVVSLFEEAEALVRTIARDDTERIVRHQLNQLQPGETRKAVENNISIALDTEDVDQSRRDLVKIMQELQGMYGCSHPDYPPRSNQDRRGGNDRRKPGGFTNRPAFRKDGRG